MTREEIANASMDDLIRELGFYDWDLLNQYADEKYAWTGEDITKEDVLNIFGEEYFLWYVDEE